MKKKGLSQVISTVIIIGLVVASISIVGTIVRNFVQDELGDAGSCSEIYEIVTFNSEYTCYDKNTGIMMISISRNEQKLDSILISVASDSDSQIFTLTDVGQSISSVWDYDFDPCARTVEMPETEAGESYCVDIDAGIGTPKYIMIAPTINGENCDVSDEITVKPCGATKCVDNRGMECGGGGGGGGGAE